MTGGTSIVGKHILASMRTEMGHTVSYIGFSAGLIRHKKEAISDNAAEVAILYI
jgi:hypothetical protein